jgi:lipopolysaccharide transport system ATP-binding protein
MQQPVITAEAVAKRYVLQRGRPARYATLRDTFASAVRDGVRSLARADGAAPSGQAEFWALRDVSFEVMGGDVVGVSGQNGAGKSTLLKLLSRITEPTRGRIRIRGRVGSLLEVGTGFHPELTGRENIFLNGAILGMSRTEIRSRFDEIVSFAEVEEFLDTPVKRYSSGMYVRLAFAVAANLEPEILIVDEVLAVGDARFQRKCLGKMREVARGEGRTVLFVSHSMASIRALCNNAIWLEKGQIKMRGPTLDVIRGYLDSTVDIRPDTFALDEIQRSAGQGESVLIRRLTINDGRPVLHGEPLSIAIDFAIRETAADVAFGIGFSSLDGVRLMSVDSDLQRARDDFGGARSGTIEARIEQLNLQPGRYAVDLAARAGEHVSLDYLPSCIWIDVLPGPHTPAVIIRDSGGVREPASWNLRLDESSTADRANG